MSTRTPETPDRSLSLLGMVASGDLADITTYRSHLGRIVAFAKTWPAKPPSLAQLTGRARMSFGAEQWRHFPRLWKTTWRDAARAASLNMTGYNLWQTFYHLQNVWSMKTLENQTHIPFLNFILRTPPAIPAPRNITPFLLTAPPITAQLRYARPLTVLPPGVTDYFGFLPVNVFRPAEEPVTAQYVSWPPAAWSATQMLNMRWNRITFTAGGAGQHYQFNVIAQWSDGQIDTSYCNIVSFSY